MRGLIPQPLWPVLGRGEYRLAGRLQGIAGRPPRGIAGRATPLGSSVGSPATSPARCPARRHRPAAPRRHPVPRPRVFRIPRVAVGGWGWGANDVTYVGQREVQEVGRGGLHQLRRGRGGGGCRGHVLQQTLQRVECLDAQFLLLVVVVVVVRNQPVPRHGSRRCDKPAGRWGRGAVLAALRSW